MFRSALANSAHAFIVYQSLRISLLSLCIGEGASQLRFGVGKLQTQAWHLARSIEADGLQVFVAVNPTFSTVDADFHPDIVGYSQSNSVFPFFPRHHNLSGEDFHPGVLLDHNVRGRADLLVGFTKHAHESQFLLARMSLNSIDGHLASALNHSVTGLIETVLC